MIVKRLLALKLPDWLASDFVRITNSTKQKKSMNNLFRGLLAGYGAKKLGGGCLGTIVIFIILWVILGQCS
jgi:hypothetical protein